MPTLLSINNYFYRRGGAEAVFLEQNRLFEQGGWQVVPFAMNHAKNLNSDWSRFFVDGIEFGEEYSWREQLTRAGKVIYSFEAQRNMRRLLREVQPSIAHAHNVYHHLSPSVLATLRRAGLPVVLTTHDLKLACPAYQMFSRGMVCEKCNGGRIHNVVARRCIKGSLPLSALVLVETAVHRILGAYEKNVDRFVVPSRFFIEKFVEWGWDSTRFAYVPNFVDVHGLRPRGGVGDSFLYFGRLAPEKGLQTLIRAAAASGIRLRVAGSGPEEAKLRKLARETNADVEFLGFRAGADLHKVIHEARAVVVPSEWYENAPVSILEGYALGRPVIGARIGGIPELIQEEKTGVTFASGQVDELAAAMRRFAAMPTSAVERMGLAGRAWVEAEFTAERYRDRLLQLYGTLGVGGSA